MEKQTLVIYSSKNVKGRHDATGAFIPEAKRFAKVNNVPEHNMLGVPCVGMKAAKRREIVLDFLYTMRDQPVEMVAWFAHGWSQGIQFGFTKKHITELVNYLPSYTLQQKHVLYACSTASTNEKTRNVKSPGTDGGFADLLRDEMAFCDYSDYSGGWVDGHLQPGHTTRNPYVFRFNTYTSDTFGGKYIVDPNSVNWRKWVKALKTDFRFKFPYMTVREIESYLEG